jgi:hypothetical protein
VDITINGEIVPDLHMELGDAGEAYFLENISQKSSTNEEEADYFETGSMSSSSSSSSLSAFEKDDDDPTTRPLNVNKDKFSQNDNTARSNSNTSKPLSIGNKGTTSDDIDIKTTLTIESKSNEDESDFSPVSHSLKTDSSLLLCPPINTNFFSEGNLFKILIK